MNLLPSYEIWGWIKGYEGRFEISNRGRLRSWVKIGGNFSTEKSKIRFNKLPTIKTAHPTKFGYYATHIGNKILNDVKSIRVHREVAIKFVPNTLNVAEVNHLKKKKDNEWFNLRWDTREDNIAHAFETGLIVAAVGEQQANTKLTNEAVLLIYRHDAKTKKIAEGFGISTHTVLDIKRGRTWWHITGHKRHIKPSEKGRFKLDPNESNT